MRGFKEENKPSNSRKNRKRKSLGRVNCKVLNLNKIIKKCL